MRVVCLSDLHGYLPELPNADLCVLAGDYCPMNDFREQAAWLRQVFKPWLKGVAKRMPVVGVAGNHDFIFQDSPGSVPELPWTYLQDSGTEVAGLKIFGSPWQPVFGGWAFNAREPELKATWAKIPSETDVLVLHGPPRGYGDLTAGNHRTGSPSLTERILEIQPRLVVAGHIHEGHGTYEIGRSVFVNAAHVDESYFPANEPIVVEL